MKNFLRKSVAVVLSVLMILLTFAMSATAAENSAIDESKLSEYHVTSEKTYPLIGGITEREIILNKAGGNYQNVIFVMEIAADNDNVTVITGYNDGDADEWGMKPVSAQAHALEATIGVEIIGSVNASFYNTTTGVPVGLFIMEDEVIRESNGYPFFGVTKEGKPVIRYGNEKTDDLKNAVSGNQMLVDNGKVVAGLKEDGTLIFCVNDGRQDPYSYGVGLNEMAEIMYALGCVRAVNLDGGGSSTFLTQREGTEDIAVRNQPSRGSERNVAVTLHIVTTAEKTGKFDHITFNEPLYDVNVNKTVNLDVYAVDENGFKTEFPEGGHLEVADETYGTINGTKFKSKDKTGYVTVNYVLDGEVLASTEVNVYRESALTTLFNQITDLFNRIRNIFERLIEELGERLFGL